MGSYIISVSVGTGCYRHIQISKSATLHRLHQAIIGAFDFDDDHGHAFFMDNKYWSGGAAYFSSEMRNSNGTTKKAKLEKLRLEKGTQFKYIFDFGDEWRFQCKVLREVDESADIPRVIRSVGEAPEQYPVFDPWDEDVDPEDDEWDDDEDDDDWDDDETPLSREQLDLLYAQIPLEKWEIDRIHKYMDAAANLYGLVPLIKLFEIYNSQNPPVEEVPFIMAAEVIDCEDNPYFIIEWDDLPTNSPAEVLAAAELAADYLFAGNPEVEIPALRRAQNSKPYKELAKDEFLKYAKPGYFPNTPQKKAMVEYLRRRKNSLSRTPEDFCSGIQDLIVVDAPLREILNITGAEGLTFDRRWDIGEFAYLYQELNNHTHKHANCGYTPVELTAVVGNAKQEKKEPPAGQMSLFDLNAQAPKGEPSRNRRCPCGSGKKYKNCCGKNK